MFEGFASTLVNTFVPTSTNTSQSGSTSKSTKRVLSQAGMDKIIADILGSDQGLAALASGENVTGGMNSSVKTQLAQDMVTKIAGELANLTAPVVEESSTSTGSSAKKKASVICTELNRQGWLPDELYQAGHAHFLSLSPYTVAGYRAWANGIVPILAKSPRISAHIAPIAILRYRMVTGIDRWNLVGALTIYLGQPICYLIGRTISFVRGFRDGNLQQSA
jgi:hypothetical protein